jgi:hypothetical protein
VEHEIGTLEQHAPLFSGAVAGKSYEGGDPELARSLLEGCSLWSHPQDGEGQVVAAGGQDGSGSNREIDARCGQEASDDEGTAAASSPGVPSSLDWQRMNVRRFKVPPRAALNPAADLAGNRRHHPGALKESPSECAGETGVPKQRGIRRLCAEYQGNVFRCCQTGRHPPVRMNQAGPAGDLPECGGTKVLVQTIETRPLRGAGKRGVDALRGIFPLGEPCGRPYSVHRNPIEFGLTDLLMAGCHNVNGDAAAHQCPGQGTECGARAIS